MTTRPIRYTYLETPIGRLLLAGPDRESTDGSGEGEILSLIGFPTGKSATAPDPSWRRDDQAFVAARRQLGEYFDGERRTFDLDLEPEGTDFQRRVWDALAAIDYGQTMSYGELAERIGRPTAVRAVGAANGRNPLPIVLPCHRVIGAGGALTGFGGGLDTKRFLLELEGVPVAEPQRSLAL